MSKRPKTATGVMSRLRRPADRLRDLPIWSKLGLIMLVPTLATIIVGVSGLVDHIDGDYLNVVGLPLQRLKELLAER